MDTKLLIKKLLNEFLTEEQPKKIAAGVLIKCITTGNVFLLLRNDKIPVWALMSGGVDKGETPLDALKREMYEELFVKADVVQFKKISVEHVPQKNMEFHYFEGFCEQEFKAILDHENLNWGWFPKDKLPSPLFKGLAEKIDKI